MEIWKDVIGYEGAYQVSNIGRVKSINRVYMCGTHSMQERIIKEHIMALSYKRYVTVHLCKNGIMKRIPVHRLVAQAFIPNPDNKLEIDHINTNKRDNRVCNLRWATRKENRNNPITKKRIQDLLRKETNPKNKKIRCVETGKIYVGISRTEKMLGIKHISCACSGHRKTAGGYHWQYV